MNKIIKTIMKPDDNVQKWCPICGNCVIHKDMDMCGTCKTGYSIIETKPSIVEDVDETYRRNAEALYYDQFHL